MDLSSTFQVCTIDPMDSTDLSSFKPLYLKTAREHIQTLKDVFLQLKTLPTDFGLLEKAYIASHSLRGESMAIGFMSTGSLCLILERIFHNLKEGTLMITPSLQGTLQEAVDKLEESIDCIEKENKEPVLNETLLSLEQASGIKSS